MVAISQAVADALGPVRGRPAVVISNGVDVGRFAPGPPDPARFAALGLPLPGGPIVGLLGTIEPIKRVHLLPNLAAHVLRDRPDARFLLVGADPGDPSGRAPGAPGSRPSPYVRRVLDGLRDAGVANRVVLAGLFATFFFGAVVLLDQGGTVRTVAGWVSAGFSWLFFLGLLWSLVRGDGR